MRSPSRAKGRRGGRKIPPGALDRRQNPAPKIVRVSPDQLLPSRESLRSVGVAVLRVPVTGRRGADISLALEALALRENLRRDHNLKTAGELLLADLLVAATMDFRDTLLMSIGEESRGSAESIGNLLDFRRRSADHLLKLLTALRESTAPPITVKVGQADKVNVAHQQINVGPPPATGRAQMITEEGQ